MRRDLFRSHLRSALVVLFLGFVRLSGAASADDPATMLHGSIDEILSIAYSGHGTGDLPARVRPALDKCFAFDLVTRQAMGPGWRQFSANDQQRVTELFSRLVIRTYAARVVGTQRPKITFGSTSSLGPDRCEISTQVMTTSNEPIAVSYRMVKL